MPTQPSDTLFNKIADQNRFRNTAWGQTALAVPAALGAPNQAAAAQMAQQIYKRPEQNGFNVAQAVGAKAKIIKDMSDLSDQIGKGKIGLAEALAKQNTAFKDVLDFVQKSYGDAASANASVAGSLNSALSSVNNKNIDVLIEQMKTVAVDPGQLRRDLEDFSQVFAQGNTSNPALAAKYAEILQRNVVAGASKDAAAFAQAAELMAAKQGVDLKGFIEQQADNGDQAAQSARTAIDAVSQDYAAITAMGMPKAMQLTAASLDQMKTGVASADRTIDSAVKILNAWDITPGSPEKTAAAIDAALKAGMPTSGAPMENYKKLLDQIDSNTIDPASTLGEARRRLFADPEFQMWMKQNGFQDPAMALHELRRQLTDKMHAQRQQDRTLMAQRRTEGREGPPMSAAAHLLSPPERPKSQAPEDGVPQLVRDDKNHIWVVSPDGTMHEPSDEEFDRLSQEILDRGDDFASVVQPPSEFAALRQKADQAEARAKSKTLIQGVTDELAEPKAPRPMQTPGTVLNEAGFMYTHPGYTLRKAGDLLFGQTRKKKTDRAIAEQAGVLGAPEDLLGG